MLHNIKYGSKANAKTWVEKQADGENDFLRYCVVWNNIVLHRSKISCFQYEYKVTKIDENILEAITFKIPE
ncbi:MAG: hypothetical protein H6Q12_960 [Bacteroidetes bacterium]|nr:hypothetical protein [Bacteroidota bacterium]